MPAPRDHRRIGLAWAFASALGGALFAVPWKLANTVGEPAISVLLLLGCAALLASVNTARVLRYAFRGN